MSMSCGFDASLLNSASKVEMKGFLDMGLLPALDGVFAEGEGMAGDAARLRNGLLEERLRERPGEGRRSVDKGGYQRGIRFRHQRPYVKQAR
jgi:hypothetical protein